jgi:hypothetical protein
MLQRVIINDKLFVLVGQETDEAGEELLPK